MRLIPTILVLGIMGFVLWRNYGVVPKGAAVDITSPKTNEQKELAAKVGENPYEAQEVKTSFGFYTYQGGRWIKTKEVWE